MELTKPVKIMIVDDDPDILNLISKQLKGENYDIELIQNGSVALERLTKSPDNYDAVLLDRLMPEISGMDILKKMKIHPLLKTIPVVFVTALEEKENIVESLQAGAYYYLTKPYDKETLLSIIKTAVTDFTKYRAITEKAKKTEKAIRLMSQGVFFFRTLEEGRDLAALLSNVCDDPGRVVIGLWELMINAVEHGNLNIGYKLKSQLRKDENWYQEIAERLNMADNKKKFVKVDFSQNDKEIIFCIKDKGSGFNWKQFFEFSSGRAFDSHGRGITMARQYSFQKLKYNDKGNEVTAILGKDRKDIY